MSIRSRLASGLRNLWRRDAVERDLDDELRAFLELTVEEKRRAGLTPDAARRAALLEIGGLEQVKERVRDVRAGAALERLAGDVSRAFRVLRRSPGFSAVAIATLALATGANTAVFSVVDTVVFRSPYGDPERLVKVCSTAPGNPDACGDLSLPDFQDVEDQSLAFEGIAADDWVRFTLTDPAGAREPVLGAMVTAGWLSTLAVRPVLGRDFLPDEARPGADRVVILTHHCWRRRFGADPGIVGTRLVLDRQAFVVVGVLPRNVLRYGADLLKPLVPVEYHSSERGFRDLDVVARLKEGVSVEQARLEMAAIARRLAALHPATNRERGLSLRPLGKTYAGLSGPAFGRASRGFTLMLAAVGMVLLIACVNVATLLIARAATRRREYAVRAALGAGRGRLVRQLLIENLTLFLCGGAAGAILARVCLGLLVGMAVDGGYVPERMAVSLDGRVLVFSMAVSLLTGLSFGLAPALQASRLDLNDVLKVSSRQGGGSRTRRSMVACELALATVLLIGFGLLARSFWRAQAVAPGFDPENLFTTVYHGPARPAGYWRSALDRIRTLPGVESAAVTSRPPLQGVRAVAFAVDGHEALPAAERPSAGDVFVSPDYFRVMGIPLLRGRAFRERDAASARPVAIVSRAVASRRLGGESPLGRRVRVADAPEVAWQVVGEVGDVRWRNLDEPPEMSLYRPYSESAAHPMFVVVRARSAADATRLAATLTSYLAEPAAGAEWAAFVTMREVMDRSESLRLRRFALIPLGVLAGLAALLAAIGVYGVMACAVAERVREIGIRMALGATPGAVLGRVLGEAMILAALGLSAGTLGAMAAARSLSAMLFDVGATDVATHLGASLLLAGTVLLACSLPARRATRVDPMVALRCD